MILFTSVFLLTVASLGPCAAQLRGSRQERNLTMPTLRVASTIAAPFLDRSGDISARGNARFEGFIKDLLETASKKYGFRYRLQLSNDGYGQRDPNTGRWSGLVGMLVDQRADMVAADLTVTDDRARVVDFTRPFISFPITILTRSLSESWWPLDLLSPFSLDLWLFLVLSFLLTVFIFALSWRLTPHEPWPLQWCDAPWYIASCCLRGAHFAPRALSTRLVAFFWGLFVILFFVLYILSLNNFVCVHHEYNLEGSSSDTGRSISDLLENEEFVFGIVPDTASFMLLRDSKSDPVHRALFERIESNPDSSLVANVAEGLKRLSSDIADTNFGLIIEGGSARYYTSRQCDLTTVGELEQRNFALALPTGSPYLSLMDNAVDQMRLSGELGRLETKWFDRKNGDKEFCNSEETSELNQGCGDSAYVLTTDSVYGLFLVLLIALVVAFLIAILELVLNVYTKRGPSDTRTGAAKKRELVEKLKAALCPCFGKKKAKGELGNVANDDLEKSFGRWRRTLATQTELTNTPSVE